MNIPQMIPWFGEEESRALTEYMESGGFLTEFKKTEELEKTIATFVGSKHCVMVCNGTISLIAMLQALNIGPDDEVIVPNFTMIATLNAVKNVGATPILIDVDPDTLCINLDLAIKAINFNTKAIFLVSANGRYPSFDIDELVQICQEKGIYLLEDSAQALGSYYQSGEHIGTKGIMGSFSFSVPKIISMGQGGCVVTNDDDLNSRLRRLKDFGRARGGIDIHDSIGFNYKITDLQACVGIEQMKKLQDRISLKKNLYSQYENGLSGHSKIRIIKNDINATAPWFIESIAENRDELQNFLKEAGIGTRVMYPPINSQLAYKIEGSFPVSEMIGNNGLWLPSYAQITVEEINYVVSKIIEYYESV